MNARIAVLLAALLAVPALAVVPGGAAEACQETLCAGAASVDATWHTGSGPGQLGSAGHQTTAGKFDPFHHSTKMVPSDGIQSRTYAKAVVVQGADGVKAAVVKTDLYLQQDIMTRRVVELVTGADPTATEYAVDGLDAEGVMLGGTHNHSAPHYTSTSWGVWIFADVFDYRAFDHTARKIAQSIKEADDALRPAQVGAAVTTYRDIQQNILGPGRADDGSPSGMPRDHFDDELSVVRFEEAETGDPIAALVNFAMHPESIGGSADLISADFTGVVEREVERALGREAGADEGPVVVWTQGGLGDVEPDQARANHPSEGREYWRRDFAQAERMSLELSAAVVRTWDAVETGETDLPDKLVPLSDDVPVAARSYRFPGPIAHPAPTVSNCRTDTPGVPIAGLPDCQRGGEIPGWHAGVEQLRAAGLPVPDNYGAPSHTGVQEALTIHLQVIQIGEVLLGACPCEPLTDMTLNFKTRADNVEDNMHLGYLPECETRDDGQIWCAFPNQAWQEPTWDTVEPDAYARMVAQITNDAAGWEDDPAALFGEAEPADPDDIYGNFTHDELDAETGFTLPLMVGTANDYVGYVVSYREHQRGDHYRKALTPFGPHTSDYINTRLVEMARELRGGPDPRDARELALGTVEDLFQTGKARVFGAGTAGGASAYETALPDDGGTPGQPVSQPAEVVERFSAALFSWEGGSNYTDNPEVWVEREVDGEWVTAATQEGGEVVLTLTYESPFSTAPFDWLTGDHVYTWTATFEAFDATEPGTYRFAVAGHHRSGGAPNPYTATSEVFEVRPWTGITVADLEVDEGAVSFSIAGHESEAPPGPIGPLPGDQIRYPYTYETHVAFISTNLFERDPYRYCFRCTFRPWATHGQIDTVLVSVDGADPVEATFDGERWVAEVETSPEATVLVEVIDEFGNTNGGAAQ